MKELITINTDAQSEKFSSLFLVEQINIFRKHEGNRAELLHKNFLAKVEDEFEDEIAGLKIKPSAYNDSSGKSNKMYELTYEQSLQILMSESKTVRKAVIEKLKSLQLKNNTPQTYLQALKQLVAAEEEKERLAIELQNTNAVLSTLHHTNKTYLTTEIAKELGFRSAKELNQTLHERGIQFKQNGTWVLYAKYATYGYDQIKQEVMESGHVIFHRKWTQAGREFLIALFGNKASQTSL